MMYHQWDRRPQVDEQLIEDMFDPVRCRHCPGIYDLGTVEVTAHYVDCSVWVTPCCRRTVDDRGETGWKSFKDYDRLSR